MKNISLSVSLSLSLFLFINIFVYIYIYALFVVFKASPRLKIIIFSITIPQLKIMISNMNPIENVFQYRSNWSDAENLYFQSSLRRCEKSSFSVERYW